MSEPTTERADPVNPSHYKDLNPEPIDVIEAWELGFNRGNCLKYLARAGRKGGGDELTDLRKAAWYLKREIGRLEAKDRNNESCV